MRVLLDKTDLEARLTTAFAMNGFVVTDVRWIKDGDEQIAVVTIDDSAGPPPKPLTEEDLTPVRETVANLQSRIEELEAQPRPAASDSFRPAGPSKGKPVKAQAAPKASAETGGLSTRVANELAKMAAEENVVGDPRGTTFRKGQRTIGPHESFDFPRAVSETDE